MVKTKSKLNKTRVKILLLLMPFLDKGITWGEMHNLLSNPNQAPITNYRRIKSEAFSRPNDLALARLLDMHRFESLVPGIDDWNLLAKRPMNVIERIEENTGNPIYCTVLLILS